MRKDSHSISLSGVLMDMEQETMVTPILSMTIKVTKTKNMSSIKSASVFWTTLGKVITLASSPTGRLAQESLTL
jgi:hypothetical protein